MMEFNTVKILWALNLLPSEKLPQIATELLVEGLDSKTLRLLAGSTATEVYDIALLFKQAMKELNTPSLSEKEALICYARLISDEIIQGKIAPYDGAKKIWTVSVKLETSYHEVDPFIYAASEYEDRPEDRDFFVSEIINEAHSWISGKKP